jgi:hypothetical protein
MKRDPVSSSLIVSVGYDSQRHILEIEFQSGTVYQYFSVPEQDYRELMSASSHGSHFNAYIKHGGFTYRRSR